MHVGLSETVHGICRSKELIQIMNRMGLCRSYDDIERLDSGLAHRTFEKAGVHRVPVPPSIEHGVLIQRAMDNFDHKENTKSGIGGSHGTVLMLFQNTANEIGDKPKEIYTKPLAEFEEKALDSVLDCQKLVRAAKYGGRCQIPATLVPSAPLNTRELEISMNADFISWVIARFATKKHISDFPVVRTLVFHPSQQPTVCYITRNIHSLVLHLPQLFPIQLLNTILSTPA